MPIELADLASDAEQNGLARAFITKMARATQAAIIVEIRAPSPTTPYRRWNNTLTLDR